MTLGALTAGTAGDGVVSLSSGGDIVLTGNVVANNSALIASQDAIYVDSGNDIILGAATNVTANTSGQIRLLAFGEVNLKATDGNGGNCCVGATNISAAGDVRIFSSNGRIFRSDDLAVHLSGND